MNEQETKALTKQFEPTTFAPRVRTSYETGENEAVFLRDLNGKWCKITEVRKTLAEAYAAGHTAGYIVGRSSVQNAVVQSTRVSDTDVSEAEAKQRTWLRGVMARVRRNMP